MGEVPPGKVQKVSVDSTPRTRGQSIAVIGLQPEDICPNVTRVPGTNPVPVSRSQCQVDDPSRFPHGISAEDAARGCLRLGVMQQALAADMLTERGFATGVDAVLAQLQLLGRAEGFSLEGSPVSGASAQASSPLTASTVRETDAGASRDAFAHEDGRREVPSWAPPGSPATGDSDDTLKLANEQDLSLADLHTASGMRGSLWDGAKLCRYINIVFELKLLMRTKKEFMDAILQAYSHGIIACVHNACNNGISRTVRIVLMDQKLLVILAVSLDEEYVESIHEQHRAKPQRVYSRDVKGSYQVLFTACDTAMLPGSAKTYIPTMMHLMAATLPMCRHWTSAVWRSRLLTSVAERLVTSCSTMQTVGLLTADDSSSTEAALRKGDYHAAFHRLLFATAVPAHAEAAAVVQGGTAAAMQGAPPVHHSKPPELSQAVAQLVDEVFDGYDDDLRQVVRQALRAHGVSSMHHCSRLHADVLASAKNLPRVRLDILREQAAKAVQS